MESSNATLEPRAARRPLKSRGSATIRRVAAALGRGGVTPNTISLASMAFAGATASCFVGLAHTGSATVVVLLLAGAIAGIQLRLLCNLIDGLVAVEGGKKTATGDLFNEVPDRVADTLVLAGAGYAIGWLSWGPELGWAAALAAALTAYVRVLGGSLGLEQSFSGPMAKQQRMALVTLACLASMAEAGGGLNGYALAAALALITGGSLLTCWLRLRGIARGLNARKEAV